ncbi:MAG: CinA family protein [Asgard group archaeon]|nr:CinA family protein [Asgard group archaeon]
MITLNELRDLAKHIVDEFTTLNITLAIAESCTGGLASSLLTDIDGSSDIFPFGLVTYSVNAKEEFLGIPNYLIAEYGTVSIECAKRMASSLLDYDVSFGLATTGVVGKPYEGKFTGTAFIAVARPGEKTIGKELKLDPNLSRFQLKMEIVGELFHLLLEAHEESF